jgi:hypothetical protein
MLRSLAVVCVLGTAAHADPAPCTPAPVDATMIRLAVQVDGNSGGRLVAAPGSQFPAVSDDGTTIVDLFQDETDFVGERVSTVATFTRHGAGAAVQLTAGIEGTDAPRTSDDVQAATRAVVDANALLAKHRWRPLALAAICPAPADVEQEEPLSRLDFADGTQLTFDPSGEQIAIDRHEVGAHFPAPGSGEFGGCGEIRGIARGYGSRKLGFVVLEPSASLGGDSCIGKLGVDTTLVVPLL